MKTHFLLSSLTIFMAVGFVGCNDSQTHLIDNKILFRADDCSDCGNCCCYIELDGTSTAATLQFCRTEDGASACTGMYTCGNMNGGGQVIVLSSTTPRKLFCMGLTSPFRIINLSQFPVDLEISCQAESGLPQTLQFTLDMAGTPGATRVFDTNNVCAVSDC
jgi:hypothetical protein